MAATKRQRNPVPALVAATIAAACAIGTPAPPPVNECGALEICDAGLCVMQVGELDSTLTVDGGIVCGAGCEADSACIPGWKCDGQGDGGRFCTCSPAPEVCDGLDNDCDGVIDDPPRVDIECRGRLGSGAECHNGACACAGALSSGACLNLSIDPANCGDAGNICPADAGEQPFCSAGTCAELASITNSPVQVPILFTMDANNLYWTDQQSILQTSLASGATVTISATRGVVDAIAVDELNIYFSTVTYGAVWAVPIGGGTLRMLAGSMYPSFGLAARGGRVYWTTNPPLVSRISAAPGQVLSVDRNGGTPSTLVTQLDNPWGIAVDSTSVYWADVTAGSIESVPLDGGFPTFLATNQDSPTVLSTDGTNLYWLNQGESTGTTEVVWEFFPVVVDTIAPNTGSVVMLPLGGATPTTLAAGQESPGWGVVSDGASIYWLSSAGPLTDNALGAVIRAPLRGGVPVTLVPEQNHPWGLAMQGGALYWSVGPFELVESDIGTSPLPIVSSAELDSPESQGEILRLELK